MPTILESLLFEIGIDTKKLSADAKEAETSLKGVEDRSHKAVQELEERGKTSGRLFKDMKEEAGSFFSYFAGAFSAYKIASMSKDIMINAENLGYMANNLGMATERLKAWQLAAEKNGGSAAGMTATLFQASNVVAASKRGLEFPGMQEFFAQGGKQEDLKSIESYLDALSRILQRAYSVSPENGMNVARLLGVNPESMNLLKQGPEVIRQILAEQAKYANVSEQWAKSSHETLNNFRNIGDSLTKIGTVMLESVNPQIKEMAELAERAAKATIEQQATIKKETPSVLNSAVAAKLFGKVGGVGSDLFFPQSTATDEQEQAAMRKWQTENSNTTLSIQKEYLLEVEKKYGLPAGVLDSVWRQESGRGKNMVSPAGAKGHFQFMDATWKTYGNGGDPMDFYDSSDAAARYLRDLLKQHNGNLDNALRWYNAGVNYRGAQAGVYSEQIRTGMINNPTAIYSNQATEKQSASNSTSNQTDVHVNGPVTINTQSTDPAGIKKEFADNVTSYGQVAQQAEMGTF